MSNGPQEIFMKKLWGQMSGCTNIKLVPLIDYYESASSPIKSGEGPSRAFLPDCEILFEALCSTLAAL